MSKVESPSDARLPFPEVIWESSIPDCWKRIFEKKQAKTRPATSKSVRVFRRELQPSSDTFERQLSTFDYAQENAASHRPQTSPKTAESNYYTIKYLGITNGEIGILSQRKPLTSPKSSLRHTIRPSTQESVRSAGVGKTRDWEPIKSPLLVDLPPEFVKPTPEKYDEFLVHQYSRPHPLSSVRKTNADTHFATAASTLAIDIRKYAKAFTPTKAVKVERKGVSGWKLTRPKSQGCIAKPRVPPLPQKDKRETVVIQPARLIEPHPGRCGEAYIEYLLLKKKMTPK